MTRDRRTFEAFPVLDQGRTRKQRSALPYPESVPWGLVEEHARQAHRNHEQSVARLAERGGMSPSELVAVLEDRPWRRMEDGPALERLRELVDDWTRGWR